MDISQTSKLLQLTQCLALDHLESVTSKERSVAPTRQALTALSNALTSTLPPQPCNAEDVLTELAHLGGPATHASPGGRYFGFVVGGSLPVALAADWLVTAFDQNAWNEATSPMAAQFERVAVTWLKEVLGLPPLSAGVLVSGCTTANITALATGRDAVLNATGWNVKIDGLIGAPPISVYLGAEAHSSVLKAMGVVGLGQGAGRHVKRLAVNNQGAVTSESINCLAAPGAPAIVVLQAGNVNTGSFDDLSAVITWARSGPDQGRGIWVHIDGAFGLFAAVSESEERRQLVAGLEHADSWATDLHKMLNVPYDSAFLAVRDGACLHASMDCAAPYVPPGLPSDEWLAGESRQPLMPELQNSRRARGIVAWAVLRQLGRKGVAALVDSCCLHASELARALQAGGVEVVNDVVLNQVLVAFGSDDCTVAVARAVQEGGNCWAGATCYRGRMVMRLSVSCWATAASDIDQAANAILQCAKALCDS